ncbi:MAG: hypothetical protein LBP59_13415 [Planctomycetaceae bacterium]|nr:hypothetical protein [Planctomycetaceae bacterium]
MGRNSIKIIVTKNNYDCSILTKNYTLYSSCLKFIDLKASKPAVRKLGRRM